MPATSPQVGSAPLAKPSGAMPVERLGSLDTFRGFTMFWLMGGKAFVLAIAALVGLDFVRYQLTHMTQENPRPC